MKKYRVKDADGEQYEIEEIETMDEEVEETEFEEVVEPLTNEEIASLRELAARAHELLALLDTAEDDVVDEEVDEVEETDINTYDEEGEEVEEDEEKVIDVKSCDSKKSIGAIERNKTKVDDSLDDDISSAWAKRFGGK